MSRFWDQSWARVDQKRVREYVNSIPLTADPIVEILKERRVKTVCDAGCGCGAYARKLAENGFRIFGFDVSAAAVEIAENLVTSSNFSDAVFKTADILATGYRDNQFDAVIARDVVDHMPFREGIAAVKELYRITKNGGILVLTLDYLDSEYEAQPHRVNSDGDYFYTEGKWEGMVFHPYTEAQIAQLVPFGSMGSVETDDGEFRVVIAKVNA